LVLVESCGNIWKLVENNLPYCLALFGTKLTTQQELIISRLGVHYIYLLLDNDEAGKKASDYIYKRLCRRFNVKIISFSHYNDISDMPNNVLNNLLQEIK
jgi:DNA primase